MHVCVLALTTSLHVPVFSPSMDFQRCCVHTGTSQSWWNVSLFSSPFGQILTLLTPISHALGGPGRQPAHTLRHLGQGALLGLQLLVELLLDNKGS